MDTQMRYSCYTYYYFFTFIQNIIISEIKNPHETDFVRVLINNKLDYLRSEILAAFPFNFLR